MNLLNVFKSNWHFYLELRRAYYAADKNPIIGWFRESGIQYTQYKGMIYYCRAPLAIPVPVSDQQVWVACWYIEYLGFRAASPSLAGRDQFGKHNPRNVLIGVCLIVVLLLIPGLASLFYALSDLVWNVTYFSVVFCLLFIVMIPLTVIRALPLLLWGRVIPFPVPMLVVFFVMYECEEYVKGVMPVEFLNAVGSSIWTLSLVPAASMLIGGILGFCLMFPALHFARKLIWGIRPTP